MNPSMAVWLFTGALFTSVAITSFVTLRSIAMRWQRVKSKNQLAPEPKRDWNVQFIKHWAAHALVSLVGITAMFLLLKDTVWMSYYVAGIFLILPYAFLQNLQQLPARWETRASVLYFLETIRILSANRQDKSILQAYTRLEQALALNSIFKKFDQHLVDLVGLGLAQRDNSADLERVAYEMESPDLIHFVRRTQVGRGDDESEIVQHAAEQITERIYLDAESAIAEFAGQTIWMWVGIVATLLIVGMILWRLI